MVIWERRGVRGEHNPDMELAAVVYPARSGRA